MVINVQRNQNFIQNTNAVNPLKNRGYAVLVVYINRIGNMPIVNKQVKFLTSQYIGTCKSAYTKGYALN